MRDLRRMAAERLPGRYINNLDKFDEGDLVEVLARHDVRKDPDRLLEMAIEDEFHCVADPDAGEWDLEAVKRELAARHPEGLETIDWAEVRGLLRGHRLFGGPEEFTVYSEKVCLYEEGGAAREDTPRCDKTEHASFRTLGEAVAYIDGLVGPDPEAAIELTRNRGVGSVEREVFSVYGWRRSAAEPGEWVQCDMEGLPTYDEVERVDPLDRAPHIRDAFDEAVRSMCRWMDYEDDGYYSLFACLDECRERRQGEPRAEEAAAPKRRGMRH